MNYVAFVLLNGIIIVRPAEFIEALHGVPLYNIAILICVALSIPQFLAQLAPASIAKRPITALIILTLPVIAFSHLINVNFDMLIPCVDEFARLILYYLVLTSAITTKNRLRGLMFWVTIFLAILALLTLLNLYNVVHIPAYETLDEGGYNVETGEKQSLIRLQASGVFNNPNAYSRILTTGVLLAMYWMTDPKMRLVSPLWLGTMGLFAFTQMQTKSRGGLLGLMFGVAALFVSRFGVKRGLPLILICLPFALILGGGRQADMSTTSGTAGHRTELWNAGLDALVGTKFLGIGMNMYPTEAHGYVAHNSFVSQYVELGFIGGTLFFGFYYILLSTLWKMQKNEEQIEDPELRRLRAFMLALIGADFVGFLSISRNFISTTYLMIGMAAMYLDLLHVYPGIDIPRFNGKLIKQLLGASIAFFTIIFVYVKYKVRSM